MFSTLPEYYLYTTFWNLKWVFQVELLQEETPEFIPPNLRPHIFQIWIQFIAVCCEHWKRRSTKYASFIWTNWNSDWEWSAPSWIMSSLRQTFNSGVVDSSVQISDACFVHFSCNISHVLFSTGFKAGEIGVHSWGGINSRVSFCNNWLIACVQWAFQVSHYSGEVETFKSFCSKFIQETVCKIS